MVKRVSIRSVIAMKGRSTTCITIRLDDSVVKSLQERAIKAGLSTPGEYIKAQILKGLSKNHSVIAINEPSHSVIATEHIPLYNPGVHKSGDKVLIKRGKQMVEAIVPEIDAEGRPIYN